jgi:hypothetical protein
MRPSRRIITFSLVSTLLGAVLGLAAPPKARAQKLPVDCSGRKSSCTTVRVCSEWHDHVCYEFQTNFWYWYF